MNKKINIKSFILGVCVALTLTSIISVSAQNIDVIMNGIKIYWDGVEKTLTDTNGTFLYMCLKEEKMVSKSGILHTSSSGIHILLR